MENGSVKRGKRIRAIIVNRGIKQKDVALQSGISSATLSAILGGYAALGEKNRPRLAAALVELGCTKKEVREAVGDKQCI